MINSIKNVILLSVIFLAGCASSEVVDNCETSQDDQTGTYQMVTREISGNCGRLGDLQVKIDEGVVLINEQFGCELREDDWNSEICASESIFYCDDGEWIMKLRWTVISETNNGDKLIGDLIADMNRFSVAYSCSSEYKFEAERSGDI